MALAVVAVDVAPAQAATPAVYQDHVYSSGATAASADKPQSKLWHNAGSWWALMVNAAGTVNIFELRADHTWRDTGTVVDERTTSTGDALWSGGTLYVVSRTDGSAGAVRVYQYVYNATTRTYARSATPFSFGGGGTESATIDKDTTGRLWVTFTRGSAVYVSRSDTTRTTWTAPYRISGADTSVSADDISGVIAFNGKIGVMWSDQASNAMRFAYHADGADDSSWTVETPLAGTGLADDHLNLKSLQGDDSGRLYAAVKTSLTGSTDPILLVLTRTTAGVWSSSTTATVADKLTRPQLALDKTNHVMYVMQSTESGGSVYYKTAPLSDRPSFSTGKGAPFIAWSGARINNVSTTKDPVTATTGLVAIAADEFAKRYYHAEVALGGTTSSTREIVVNPVADTMVKQASPSTAFGSANPLKSDTEEVSGTAGTAVNSYVRFTVPALAAGESISSARLSLQVTNATTNGPAVWRTGTAWQEGTTTWSSGRPGRVGSAPVGNFGSMATGRVSAAVSGVSAGGDLSLELAPESTDGTDVASREDATTSRRPQLVLTVTR